MSRSVEIVFTENPDDPDLRFKIWIFAEDVHKAFRDGELASFSLAQVDAVDLKLSIAVRSKAKLRRAMTVVEDLLARHFPAGSAVVSISGEGTVTVA